MQCSWLSCHAALSETVLPPHATSSASAYAAPFVPSDLLDASTAICVELNPHALQLVTVITAQLVGRIWDGKPLLLQALADVSVYCRTQFVPSTAFTLALCEPSFALSALPDTDPLRVLIPLVRIIMKPMSDNPDGGGMLASLAWRAAAVVACGRVACAFASVFPTFAVIARALDCMFDVMKAPVRLCTTLEAVAAAASGDAAIEPPTKRATGLVGMKANTELEAEHRAAAIELAAKQNSVVYAGVLCASFAWPSSLEAWQALAASPAGAAAITQQLLASLLAWLKQCALEAKSSTYAAIER